MKGVTAASGRLFEVKMDIYATPKTKYELAAFPFEPTILMLSVTVPQSPFEEPGNRAGCKEVHEDPTGKLPADFLQCRQSESHACTAVSKLSSFPSQICHGERTTSASWIHRNPEFPRRCSGVTSVSS